MKSWKIVSLTLVTVTGLYFVTRDNSPEQRVASHLGGLCGIARSNATTPVRGVDQLFAYLGGHTADTLHDMGELVVEVQSISDEKRAEERARRANKIMRAPLERCHADVERFFGAVSKDPEASAKLERGADRLERTMNLLFSSNLTELSPLYSILHHHP